MSRHIHPITIESRTCKLCKMYINCDTFNVDVQQQQKKLLHFIKIYEIMHSTGEVLNR